MHPCVRILFYITTLLGMNFLAAEWIAWLCLGVCAIALKLQPKPFIKRCMRMRWLFLSLFIIYAFGTPGEYLPQFPIHYAPTVEGCLLGILQIAKLLIALATLSILFYQMRIAALMTGLYDLLSPLKYIGFHVDRFTVRLLLTLHYVDALALSDKKMLTFHQLQSLSLDSHLDKNNSIDNRVELQRIAFTWVDLVALFLLVGLFTLALLKLFL